MSYESRMRWIALQVSAIKEAAVTTDERLEEIDLRIDMIHIEIVELKPRDGFTDEALYIAHLEDERIALLLERGRLLENR